MWKPVSSIPYSSIRWPCIRARNSRIVSTGHEAPPVMTTRSEERSSRPSSGSFSIAMIEAGAVGMYVTRSRSISSSAARALNWSRSTARAPAITA